MRTFTSNFLTAAASKAARPYQILQVDWGGDTGTVYYLDRASDSFSATGTRVPASGIGASLVMQWPAISLTLKEGQVGSTDQCSVVLNDASGEITAILNLAEKQRKLVTVWRMFDDSSVEWPTDAAQAFTGILMPFNWTAQDNQITLNLGDLGPLLAKDVSCIATDLIFDKLPQASKDKNIPLCWGKAQRVEALMISAPWETKIIQSFNGGNPVTLNIADHPDTMPGVTAETAYSATLGTDAVTATFHQSADETNTPSTVTISVSGAKFIAQAGIAVENNPGPGGSQPADVTFYWYAYGTIPQARQADLADILAPGGPTQISGCNYTVTDDEGGSYSGTVQTIELDTSGDLPVYIVTVGNISVGGGLFLWDLRNILNVISFFSTGAIVNPWPTGTILRSADTTFIYAISALPSKAVQQVEGYGTLDDASGSGRKDFVALGQSRSVTHVGTTTTIAFSDEFTVNLNDSTWNTAGLGRNITTITFAKAPRDTRPNLDDNRVWCTVLGVEDAGDSTGNLISNPATVILQYLENVNLMNVDSGSIDATSFSAAASALSGYIVGFPQIETRPGLQLLQEIATQCNSVLLFDQGKASMVVLSDTPGTIRATFDTVANDNMLQGSLSTQESSVADIINEAIVKWTPYWDDITGKKPQDVRNYKPDSITAFGRISREIPIYLYWRRADVETQRDWWLDHLSSIFRTVRFTTFLNALILQPGDYIDVTWIDGNGRDLFGGSKSMMVTKVTDTGKDGLVEIEARYVIYTYS